MEKLHWLFFNTLDMLIVHVDEHDIDWNFTAPPDTLGGIKGKFFPITQSVVIFFLKFRMQTEVQYI